MTSFVQHISSWETFYLLTGTAAATLVGLLFVAVSIDIDAFRQKAHGDLQIFAALTFNCFFYVLLVSILFLIPEIGPLGLGLSLFLLGVLGLANALNQWRKARRIQNQHTTGSIAGRFVAPCVALAGLAAIGILVIAQLVAGLYAMVVVVIALLAIAAVNAFSLLVGVTDTGEK